MIKITIEKINQNIVSIQATGHSGYANSGHDIVCSAVSTLLQTLIVGLSEIAKVDIDYSIDEQTPSLFVGLKNNLTNEQMNNAQLLMKTTRLGIEQIADGYGKFIKIKEKQND